jgi:large subunit ribosomal protein L11
MIIKLLIDGGDMKPGPAIAQQLGPMGINMGKVISTVNAETKEFKGMKVPVEIHVDKKTKDFQVKVFSPPTSELLKKELKLEKGTNDHKNIIVGNASIEDIIKIAKIKQVNMLEKNLKNAVKSILGTARTLGLLVENKNPNDLVNDVNEGIFDKEIDKGLTETSTEKRKNIEEYFNQIKHAQDLKAEQAKKVAEAEATAAQAKPADAAKAPADAAKAPAAKSGSASQAKAAPEKKADAKKK